MQNPYTTLFVKIPDQIIPRAQQTALVTDAFTAQNSNQQVYVVTGVRGTGKTVFMTDVSRMLAQDDRWIIEELSVEPDLLQSLVSRLNSKRPLAELFTNAKIDLSLFGLGLRIQGTQPIASLEVALEHMLQTLARQNKRLLVTIDEVVNNAHMREFASIFQILIRKDLPVYLLMTGLYEPSTTAPPTPTVLFMKTGNQKPYPNSSSLTPTSLSSTTPPY